MKNKERLTPSTLRALSMLGKKMPTTEQEVADVEEWAEMQPLSERMKSSRALETRNDPDAQR